MVWKCHQFRDRSILRAREIESLIRFCENLGAFVRLTKIAAIGST